MNTIFTLAVITLAVITLAIIIGLTITFYFSPIENNKIEAQKIIEFQNTDHSCDELKNFYLKYYPKKFNSQNDLRWYWEIKGKLYENDCISPDELHEIEFIETCSDGVTTGCHMSKLKYPELYENFDFRTSIEDKIKQNVENEK